MSIHELTNYVVTAIHYPTWSDYFERQYAIEDMETFFLINQIYIIEKEQIADIEKKESKISVSLKSGQKIILFAQEKK